MILNHFSYSAPETIEEAISLLTETGFEVFTGDQSHVGNAKRGIVKPSSLVSLRKVPGLKSIKQTGNQIEIGAAVTFGALLSDPVISAQPLLSEALKAVRDPHMRNHSNAGGALYHNAPVHAPVLAAFVVLDAKVIITGPSGTRETAIESYFENNAAAGLANGEIIIGIVLDMDSQAQGSFHYIDYLKSGKAVCGVAVSLSQENNMIKSIRIVASGCVTKPTRLTSVETYLTGKEITDSIIGQALHGLSSDSLSISNPFVSNPSHLLHLLKVLVKRAVLNS